MSPKKKLVSLGVRLAERLKKLGLRATAAEQVAKGLVPTIGRATVGGSPLKVKLIARLMTLGVSPRKAKEIVKGVAPLATAAIKAKAKLGASAPKDTALVKASDLPAVAAPGSVVRVFRLRRDEEILPVDTTSAKGVEPGRIMDGLTSSRSYIVVATKGDHGIIAVRQYSANDINVKFYPTMQYWGEAPERMVPLQAESFLRRAWYERMHFPPEGVEQLLNRMEQEAQRDTRRKKLQRLLLRAVSFAPVWIAFSKLYGGFSEEAVEIPLTTPTSLTDGQ